MLQHYYILDLISRTISIFCAFLIIYTVKGFFQACVASFLGDPTPRNDGFYSLNPLMHVDIIGLSIIILCYSLAASMLPSSFPRSTYLMLPLIFSIQWTIPISLNANNFKRPTLGSIIVALTGPISLFLLAFIVLILLHAFLPFSLIHNIPHNIATTILNICSTIFNLAIWFGVFNLLPLPPLDGSIILRQLLPYNQQHIADWLEEYALYIILILFFCPIVKDVFLGFIESISMFIKNGMFSLLSLKDIL